MHLGGRKTVSSRRGRQKMMTKMGKFQAALAWVGLFVAVVNLSCKCDAFMVPTKNSYTQRNTPEHAPEKAKNHGRRTSQSSNTILYTKSKGSKDEKQKKSTKKKGGDDLSSSSSTVVTKSDEPQVLATGYSQQMELSEAIKEAMEIALQALPDASNNPNAQIDLAIISISSLYDGNSSPSTVVPACLDIASSYGRGIQHLVGSSVGGIVSSVSNMDDGDASYQEEVEGDDDDEDDDDNDKPPRTRTCTPAELEGVPGVSVMLAILPDVNLKVRILNLSLVAIVCLFLILFFRLFVRI